MLAYTIARTKRVNRLTRGDRLDSSLEAFLADTSTKFMILERLPNGSFHVSEAKEVMLPGVKREERAKTGNPVKAKTPKLKKEATNGRSKSKHENKRSGR